jgi:hypothetical protein
MHHMDICSSTPGYRLHNSSSLKVLASCFVIQNFVQSARYSPLLSEGACFLFRYSEFRTKCEMLPIPSSRRPRATIFPCRRQSVHPLSSISSPLAESRYSQSRYHVVLDASKLSVDESLSVWWYLRRLDNMLPVLSSHRRRKAD